MSTKKRVRKSWVESCRYLHGEPPPERRNWGHNPKAAILYKANDPMDHIRTLIGHAMSRYLATQAEARSIDLDDDLDDPDQEFDSTPLSMGELAEAEAVKRAEARRKVRSQKADPVPAGEGGSPSSEKPVVEPKDSSKAPKKKPDEGQE